MQIPFSQGNQALNSFLLLLKLCVMHITYKERRNRGDRSIENILKIYKDVL